ncbi:MAG: hypothetical protein RLZZ628_3753 [Bacteroidota bacterium]|jgi:hypothetical protein
MDFFKSNRKSIGEQIAEANAQNFFSVADRNESVPKHAMYLSHFLSISAFLAGIYYLPVGLLWKIVGVVVGTLFFVRWEQGRNQFLIDFHKGEAIKNDKNPHPKVLEHAEDLIIASQAAKMWIVIFTTGDLFITMGMWLYTTYVEAVAMNAEAVSNKGKIATQHLATVKEAIKGGYGAKTLGTIGDAAAKASNAITINYTPIVVTMLIVALAIIALQAFTYACSQWYVGSCYANEKKKFQSNNRQQQPAQQPPIPQLPTRELPIRRAG